MSEPRKTLPTQRLTLVLSEAIAVLESHKKLRDTLVQVIKSWGKQPPSEALAELRDAIDEANLLVPTAIPEALAYLKLNAGRLTAARKRQRKYSGASAPKREFDPRPYLPSDQEILDGISPEDEEIFSLEDIERRLALVKED